MVHQVRRRLFLILFLALLSHTGTLLLANATRLGHRNRHHHGGGGGDSHGNSPPSPSPSSPETASYCLSWRLAVEANNVKAWRTAPTECWPHIQKYMIDGQYNKDLNFIMQHINVYVDGIQVSDDGMDAWILDIDDTCLSNLLYYSGRRFGCEPYDPEGFKSWASKGESAAIPPVLGLFKKLVDSGFKVMFVTGRDEQLLGEATAYNLMSQGYFGYERLIMRTPEHRGESAITYKSGIRKELTEEGYRLWGNVGDQWSDLQGDCPGNRSFKLPNPMYFVP